MNYKHIILSLAFGSLISSCTVEKSATIGRYYADSLKSGYTAENQPRKVISNVKMVMNVDDRDTAIKELEAIAEKYDGYLNEVGSNRTVIRVKNEQLSEALEEVSLLGDVVSKDLRSREVTDQYEDLHIRLDNAEKSRLRYLELLNKARTVAEALLVEHELERLSGTIDLLKGKINRMEHLTAYATISVHLKDEVKPGILGYVGIAIYQSVKWLFIRG